MSREDWWSVAATLIVSGIGYFVGGEKTAYGCLIVGFIIAIILHLTRSKKEKNPAPPTSSVDNSASQTQTGIKFEQHIYPAQTSPVLPVLSEPPLEPKEPDRRSNIRCLGPQITRLRTGISGYGFYEDAEGSHRESNSAAIICFRNEALPDRKVRLVYNVKASIVFTDDVGQEMGTGIAEACWVGDLRDVDFPLQRTNCAIVALVTQNGVFTCPYIRRTRSQWGDGLTVDFYRLDKLPKAIEVRLIHGTELLLPPCIFDFSVSEGKPIVQRRS